MKVLFYILVLLLPRPGLILYFVYRNKPAQADRTAARAFLILGIASIVFSCMCSTTFFLLESTFLRDGNQAVMPGEPFSAGDRLSPIYQAHHEFDPGGMFTTAPGRRSSAYLQLLGEAAGLRIDQAAGGGQCRIAFARQGAIVTGVDLSEAQLAYAGRLAAQEEVAVRLVQASAEDLSALASGSYDLVFSVNTLTYVARAADCLAECCRVLVRGGRLVFSLDHPLRYSFLDPGLTDLDDELSIVPVRSYYDDGCHRWRWPGSGIVLQSYHRTIGQWTDLLAAAGLQLLRIVEPMPPADLLDDLLPEDGAQAPLRLIPHTVILDTAQKG